MSDASHSRAATCRLRNPNKLKMTGVGPQVGAQLEEAPHCSWGSLLNGHAIAVIKESNLLTAIYRLSPTLEIINKVEDDIIFIPQMNDLEYKLYGQVRDSKYPKYQPDLDESIKISTN